jgi:uncharacterized protein
MQIQPQMNRARLAAIFLVAGAAGDVAQAADDVKVERNVMVRMRDGVSLATDLYLPTENGQPLAQKLPAVLQRTPYGKNKKDSERLARLMAQHGYLSVVQDCRGRFESEGEYFPFVQEPEDGFDTIAWLVKHPACNGKVGMFGSSYRTWVQFEAAATRPPGLVTIIADQGPTNGYLYSMHPGGARHLGLLEWSLRQASNSQEAQRDPTIKQAIQTMYDGGAFPRWAARMPWQRGQTPLSRLPHYEDWAFRLFFENDDYNAFWQQPGLAMDERFESFPDMPILWIGGWYDWYPRSISDGYQSMVRLKRANQHLLIGAWTHDNGPHDNVSANTGDVHFGLGEGFLRGGPDFEQLQLRWFQRWLKEDKSVDVGKPVSVFVMGGGDGKRVDGRINHGGAWRYPDAWPPSASRPVEFYLQPGGKLGREKPMADLSSTAYTFDPKNTVSSNTRCFIRYGPNLKEPCLGGPRDQIELETLPGHGLPGMPLSSRPDVLVFQTEPLATDVTIAGNIKAVLYVSSDAPDTDFFVKVIDVHPPKADFPNGFALQLADGVIRARYREGYKSSSLMKAGEVYRIELPLEPSANRFLAKHRIRVDICSSNFPSYDINHNTGAPNDRRWRVANNTVWHDAARPTCVILPVLE